MRTSRSAAGRPERRCGMPRLSERPGSPLLPTTGDRDAAVDEDIREIGEPDLVPRPGPEVEIPSAL